MVKLETIIDELNITAQNRDTQGDIYEYLLSELKTAGKNGQFRTLRHIIGMIVELIDPDIGDRICDPACGTAGFLINSFEYIIRKHTSPDMVKEDRRKMRGYSSRWRPFWDFKCT